MSKLTAIASAAVLLAAATAFGAPIIDVGAHDFLPDTSGTIAITVSGGDAVEGLDLYIQIGDGGSDNGGTDTIPVFTSIDIVGAGTMFNGNNTGQVNTFEGDLLRVASTTTDSGTVNATGTVAYVTIDTTGTSDGESYPLLLKGVAAGMFPPSGVDTDFAGVPIDITNGTINIIPEPASALLLLIGAPLLGLRRRRR